MEIEEFGSILATLMCIIAVLYCKLLCFWWVIESRFDRRDPINKPFFVTSMSTLHCTYDICSRALFIIYPGNIQLVACINSLRSQTHM